MKKTLILKQLIIATFLTLTLFSCKKDDDNPNDAFLQPGNVIVLNEGQFMAGNASVSFFNTSNSDLIVDLFESQNNRPLGDVLQSIYIADQKAYLVVNNSGKIEIVDTRDFKSLGTITGFTSPRYILPVSSQKAYVSDLFSGSISIVNLNTNTITGTITTNGQTEEMLLVGGRVYVANTGSSYVYVINPNNDTKEDSILVAGGPNSMRVDQNGKVWVLSQGLTEYDQDWNIVDQVPGGLYKINPTNKSVELSFSFSTSDFPTKLNINGSKNKLYFLNNGVFSMNISDVNLPGSAFISQGTASFYGLGVNPSNGDIYVGDAIDFVQRGVVYRYSADGTLIEQFLAGINPNGFAFN